MLPTDTLPAVTATPLSRRPLRATAFAALAAVALAAVPASPALAWGDREQGFLAGVATSLIVGTIANDIRQKNRARQQQYNQQPTYYVDPRQYQPPRATPAPQPSYSVYRTPAARAFGSYALSERKAIQRRLAGQGYYRSGIDGSFGPGTYNAVLAYARDTRQTAGLDSTAGVYGIYDGLLY